MHRRIHGVIALLALLLIAQTPPPPAPDPLSELSAQWAALKDVKTLTARFICEKNLAALDTPLHSEGRVWIQKGPNGRGEVRFSTEKPYVSELILADGKVYARSQHESDWTKTNQSGRPGLTAVMTQLGSWSTGDAAKIAEMYAVTKGDAAHVPPMPDADASQHAGAIDAFVLTPTNKDLAKSVKQITLALDQHMHTLRFIEIITRQDDVTRYWFYDVRTNTSLPAAVFKPEGQLVPPEDRKP